MYIEKWQVVATILGIIGAIGYITYLQQKLQDTYDRVDSLLKDRDVLQSRNESMMEDVGLLETMRKEDSSRDEDIRSVYDVIKGELASFEAEMKHVTLQLDSFQKSKDEIEATVKAIIERLALISDSTSNIGKAIDSTRVHVDRLTQSHAKIRTRYEQCVELMKDRSPEKAQKYQALPLDDEGIAKSDIIVDIKNIHENALGKAETQNPTS